MMWSFNYVNCLKHKKKKKKVIPYVLEKETNLYLTLHLDIQNHNETEM